MPPKLIPIKIVFPTYSAYISYAMEILAKNDFNIANSLAIIDKLIETAKDETLNFYKQTRAYIETAEITITQ